VIKHTSSFTIIIVFLLFILCGISLVHYLNFELNPNTRSSSFSVNFSWFGTEPRVIEQEATSRLEALFAQVRGIKEISSVSGNGSGNIILTLDKGVNPDVVRFEISSLIRQAWPEMPTGTSFPTLNAYLSDDEKRRPLLTYNLNASLIPPIVQQYAEDHIKPALSQIKGVNKIDIYGASPFEWVIEFDAEKIKSTGVTPGEIQKAVSLAIRKEYSVVQTSYGTIVPVTLQTNFFTETDILNIPVKKIADRITHLGDIATLKHVEGQPSNYYRINGLNTINILIYAGPGENNLVLGENVKKAIQQISSTLPSGYELLLSDDSTEYINHELNNIALRSLCTFLILLLFILLATRRWKHGLLILVMLIGNLSVAVIFYYVFRLEIHLYALAGITVSLGLMTDNIIIMSDHIRYHGNRKAFLAILAGTLATISSLTIIFFLKDKIKTNLVDFAMVIIINQSVSLMTALFVIPALMDKLRLDKYHLQMEGIYSDKSPGRKRRQVFIVRFTNIYRVIFLFLRKKKIIALGVFVLGFGLPVYLLPEKWEGNKWYNKAYNKTIGNEWYKSNARSWVDKCLGGTLRLFTEKVYDGSFFGDEEETSLFITATMPRGSTLLQANDIVSGMERYLKQFNEIKLFQTSINSRNAFLNIYFTKETQRSAFPNILKGKIISKAIELGGADWMVFGVGIGFSNRLYDGAGNYAVKLLGYNYDRLISMAEMLRDSLTGNPRIKQVYVLSETTWYKPDNMEFVAHINNEDIVTTNITSENTLRSLGIWSLYQSGFANIVTNRGIEIIKLRPQYLSNADLWSLSRTPLIQDSVMYKFNTFSSIEKEATSPNINKIDQQYQVYLQFDYIGSEKAAQKYIDNKVKNFERTIPIGYTISSENTGMNNWSQQDKKQYWLLLLIVVMIFFICSVLFESLLQPFAVILTIPVAYIGIFLTFYLFGLNFDQGGFAALVLISGITVNAAIYILNDFNNLRRQNAGRKIPNIKLYFKAFNYKIIPILLTVVSTVLGFVPFLIGEKQPFWFALAAGTIGGLVFSLVGIIFYLPLFLGIKENKEIRN
jgi:multidrug efflux pump subunit AcrB